MTLPLHTFAKIYGDVSNHALKVLDLDEALASNYPFNRIVVLIEKNNNIDMNVLQSIGFAALLIKHSAVIRDDMRSPAIYALREEHIVKSGDVIRVKAKNGQIGVLYRRGANANSLFVTERCNSKCIMCSQPPQEKDDSWIADEILDYIPLIDKHIDFLGITGGEPTLLGDKLVSILQTCEAELPNTKIHILSNGKNFSDEKLVSAMDAFKDRTIWAVPLYSDIPHIHDYVVQSKGAFNQTLNGLYNLAEHGHTIEIRFVMHQQTINRIQEFSDFVYHNLPFVSHVAFMGLEPIGYGKVNLDSLWINLDEYSEAINKATWYLEDRGIVSSIYNVPLCALSKGSWPLARKSISDWKNKYYPECDLCTMKTKCCGFFASHGASCNSTYIKAIL